MADLTDKRKLHIRLDSELHRLVRIRCAELDVTIQDYVVRLLEGALRRSVKNDPDASKRGLNEAPRDPDRRSKRRP